MGSARQAYERRMAQTFAEDVKRNEFESKIRSDRTLEGNATSDERVMNKRRSRQQAEQAQEREIEMRIKQAAQLQKQRALAEKEELLAAELERRKNASIREERIIEKVKNEAPELRELEQKLRAAYMNQERRVQLQEQVLMKEQERERHAIADLQMEARRIRDLRAEEEKQAQRRQENLAAKAILKEQMLEQDEAKAAAYAEFIKEKALVDEIIAKIMEEEKQEALAKMAKRKETIEYVKNYLRDNEMLKAAEKQRLQDEDDAIAQYAESVRAREGAAAAKKAALEEAKEKIFQAIAKDIMHKQHEEEEMLELQIELANQEAEERRMQADKAALEKRLRDRMEMMAANEYQKKLKMERLAQVEAEESEFRRKMMERFAEDERIEQMNAQKRRMKMLEHKREVERLLEERRSLYEQEKAAELEEQNEEERRAKVLRDLIETERQKILVEAASKLGLEYLPRGVLQSKDDFELFRRAQAAKDYR